MGRSRAIPHSDQEDLTQSRSKRKKTAHNLDSTEAAGEGTGEGKKALYHCNYCNKDLSGKIRIKCLICSDFDLCIECFSVGAEVHPHKCNHPYRVMDNLLFPLICFDWNADEEILLLEGIEMYGFGNWNEVAEHVATKNRSQCIEHYKTIYMHSPCFPLPDMSHVMGKNREELLAMAREQGESQKGFPSFGEAATKEDSPSSIRMKVEDQKNEGPASCSSSSLSFDSRKIGFGTSSSGATIPMGSMMESNVIQSENGDDGNKDEDRSIGEKKPRASADEAANLMGLSGYNPKRQEFEIEYDNDAEQLLADMEFKESDSDAEHELKVQVLRIYSKRLDERKRRKDFILERNLLYPDPFEKDLSHEEKEICRRYRVFMRFHSREEHFELLRSLIEEHRILKKIQDLQDAHAAGCRMSAEAEGYIEHKRKSEAEEDARKVQDSALAGSGGKVLLRTINLKGEPESSPRGTVKGSTVLDTAVKETPSENTELAVSSAIDNWDVTGLLGADLLSESEKQLCGEIRILPTHYLRMLQMLSIGIVSGNITEKADAHSLFNVDPNKVDKVYDMLVAKGITLKHDDN